MRHWLLVEALARWAWQRWQHRFSSVFIVTSTAIGLLVIGWPGIIAVALYLGMPLDETLIVLAISTVMTVVLVGGAHRWFGRVFWRRMEAWVAGDRSEVDALRAEAYTAHRQVALRSGVVVTLGGIAVTDTAVTLFADLGWIGFLVVAATTVLGVQAGVLVIIVSFDLLLRPFREALDADAPGWVPPPPRFWGLESRLVASAAALAWVVGTVAPVAALQFDWGPSQLAAAMAASAVLVLANSIGVFWLLGVRPVLRPISDLIAGTRRVAQGDYTNRLSVTSDDELGQLVAAFNQMQDGLTERERLHAAFGSYVDPGLAERLLRQGDALFPGEEVEVTVFFVDVRGFTAYADRASPRETVDRLNELFEVVVPVIGACGGHANKFLGDGLLAVFGVPERLPDHAGRAVAAAVQVQREVRAELGEELRIGVGINTGTVVAGTVGGGGKLEFTLIGDTVNVAARVEQLTKETGDPILLTEATLRALAGPVAGLVARGEREIRGKSAPVVLHGLDPFVADTSLRP